MKEIVSEWKHVDATTSWHRVLVAQCVETGKKFSHYLFIQKACVASINNCNLHAPSGFDFFTVQYY